MFYCKFLWHVFTFEQKKTENGLSIVARSLNICIIIYNYWPMDMLSNWSLYVVIKLLVHETVLLGLDHVRFDFRNQYYQHPSGRNRSPVLLLLHLASALLSAFSCQLFLLQLVLVFRLHCVIMRSQIIPCCQRNYVVSYESITLGY